MGNKRPSLQFYPGDWLRDNVAGCSIEAQGLWLRMLMVMHDSEAYGYLSIAGKGMTSDTIARRCGCFPDQYETLLCELLENGVPSVTEDGVIYSRRLVKEENEDRKELYAAVAEALDIDSEQIPRIRRIFAENWIRKSRPGWWIQTKEGRWIRKPDK